MSNFWRNLQINRIWFWKQYKDSFAQNRHLLVKFYRFFWLLFFLFLPSWQLTEYITHHKIIDDESVYFESKKSGVLTMYRAENSKILMNPDDAQKDLEKIAKDRFANIASQILNINDIEYEICKKTEAFVSTDSGKLKYIGDIKSLDVMLASYRSDKDKINSYLPPIDRNKIECVSFGRFNENIIDSISFPNSDFPYYDKPNIKGYVIVKLELIAYTSWRTVIFLVSLLFIGNFWLLIFAVSKFINKGLKGFID